MFTKLKDASREKQLGVMSSDPPARETARLQKHWIQLLKQRADEGRMLGISINVQESLSIREERLPQSPQSVKCKTQRVALCLNSARNRNKIQLFSSNSHFILKNLQFGVLCAAILLFFFFNLMSLDALSAEISLLCSLGQIILFYTYFFICILAWKKSVINICLALHFVQN